MTLPFANWYYLGLIQHEFKSIASYNIKFYLTHDTGYLLNGLIRGWLEVVPAHFLTLVGFLYGVYSDKSNRLKLLLFIPPVLALNFVFGFILNGAFERYTMPSQAFMSMVAGFGLLRFFDRIGKSTIIAKFEPIKAFTVLLALQLTVLNIGVVTLSEAGANSIYDFGIWYDLKVIDILNREAKSEFIAGTPHGAFVKNATWMWAIRDIDKAIKADPDWLVTFKAWVEVKPDDELEVYNIGPYILIHSHPRGHIDEYVKAKNFGFWKLRK